MSRIKIVLISLAVLIVGGAAAAGGLYVFAYPKYLAGKILELAAENEAAGRWEEAAERYGWYATRYPGRPGILEKYIECNLNILKNRRAALGRVSDAYIRIARKDPSDLAHREKAIQFMSEYDFWDDIETLIRVYSPDEETRSVQDSYLLAVAAERLGRTSEALTQYKALIPRYSELVTAKQVPRNVYLGAARILTQQGLSVAAREIFENAAAAVKADPQFNVQEASFLSAQGETRAAHEKIEEAFEKAGTPEALGYETLMVSAQLASQLEESELAGSRAKLALTLAPERPQAYFYLAYAYDRDGKADEAITLLEGLDEKMFATYTKLYLVLAELQLQEADLEGAARTAAEVKKVMAEGDTFSDYILARSQISEGNYLEAEETLARLVLMAPSFTEMRKHLFVAYLGLWADKEYGSRTAGSDLQASGPLSAAEYMRKAESTLNEYLQAEPDDPLLQMQKRLIFGGNSISGHQAARTLLARLRGDESYFAEYVLGIIKQVRSDETGGNAAAKALETYASNMMTADRANPLPHNLLVQAQAAQGRVADARKSLATAEEALGGGENLSLARAAIALAEGDSQAAQSIRNAAYADGVVSVTDAATWAYLFARRGDLEAGITSLENAAEGMEGDDRARTLLSQVSLASEFGELARARELSQSVEGALASSPEFSDYVQISKINLARYFLQASVNSDDSGAYQSAKNIANELAETASSMPEFRLLQGQIHLQADPPELDQAQDIVTGLEGPDQESGVRGPALTLLHDIAKGKGEPAVALRHLRAAQELRPDDPVLRWAVCRTLYENGRFSEARSLLETVLEEDPENLDAMGLLVQVFAQMGLTPQAQLAFDRLSVKTRDNEEYAPRVASIAAWLEVQQGDAADAEEQLRADYERDPDDYEALSRLVRCIYRQRNSNSGSGENRGLEAIDLLAGYADTHPENERAWYLLGTLYRGLASEAALAQVKNGYLKDSVTAYVRATVVAPDYTPAMLGLIDAQGALGEVGTATGLLETHMAKNATSDGGGDLVDPGFIYRKALLTASYPTRTEEALGYVENAILRATEDGGETPFEYLILRGNLNMRLSKYELALEDYLGVLGNTATTSSEYYILAAEAALGVLEQELTRGELSVQEKNQYFNRVRNFLSASRNVAGGSGPTLATKLESLELRLQELENTSSAVGESNTAG